MKDLSGKNVVVIGGSSGMGLAIVHEAASIGASVTIGAHSQDSIDRALESVETASVEGDVSARLVDLTDDASVEAFFDAMERVDHLVVTASPGGQSRFGTSSVAEAHSYMEGKFWGSYRAAHYAHRLIPEDGSLLLLSGGLAQRPNKGSLMVTCAFAATEALGRALAVELAPRRVNTIRPGTIDSPMWSGLPEEERRRIMGDAAHRVPAGRAGKPEDVGVVGVMLMLAEYVTGHIVRVDGGIHIADPY